MIVARAGSIEQRDLECHRPLQHRPDPQRALHQLGRRGDTAMSGSGEQLTVLDLTAAPDTLTVYVETAGSSVFYRVRLVP